MLVTTPAFRYRLKKMAPWMAGASSLLYVFSLFLPWRPATMHGEIEDSYMQVLHKAFSEHWQFGRDICYTFGAWGLLYGGSEPSTHWVCVLAWCGLSIVFWWASWRVASAF